VTSPDEPEPERSSDRLAAEWRRLQLRYGAAALPPAERLEIRARAVRGRLRHVEAQIAELTAERDRLRQEAAGYEKALTLAIGSELDRLRQRHGEVWSPFPIRGYRVWSLRDGCLSGARMQWRDPWLTAQCARGRGRLEVPHSDGRCGTPACGIYAVKDPAPMLVGPGLPASGAMGLVELTGKVVEHARGYRAERARVVALGMIGDRRWLTTDAPEIVTAAFHDPEQTLVRWGRRHQGVAAVWSGIVEYLVAREEEPWT
jgi:hypothetical protein